MEKGIFNRFEQLQAELIRARQLEQMASENYLAQLQRELEKAKNKTFWKELIGVLVYGISMAIIIRSAQLYSTELFLETFIFGLMVPFIYLVYIIFLKPMLIRWGKIAPDRRVFLRSKKAHEDPQLEPLYTLLTLQREDCANLQSQIDGLTQQLRKQSLELIMGNTITNSDVAGYLRYLLTKEKKDDE